MTWQATAEKFWPIVAVSFLVSLAATPICRVIALKLGILDRPDDFLKPHQKPIPYLGGVAVFAGWLAGIGVAFFMEGVQFRQGLMVGIVLAGLFTMLIGLFDDLRFMRPAVKLAANIGVAVLLLWMGLGDRIIQVLTHFTGVKFAPDERWLELAYSAPITLFIVVGACNATNLIDGLDGLCTGVLAIISIGFFILAAHLVLYSGVEVPNHERMILVLAMLGAAVGFLPFNFNPARIFLGDAGSMLLGLNAAVLILLFGEQRLVRWMLGALMVFGLPIADMMLTLARRWRNGRPLMEGDRSHFYDQLRDRGMSVRQVVTISYLLTVGFVLVGTLTLFLQTRYLVLVYSLVVLLLIAAVGRFNMVSIEPRAEPRP
jgi:UDP-GlcNAc:undecaprenyl-phosphate/decaprenyl-phosphate GlcNAc-1-phosphate transferase